MDSRSLLRRCCAQLVSITVYFNYPARDGEIVPAILPRGGRDISPVTLPRGGRVISSVLLPREGSGIVCFVCYSL